MTSYFYIHSMIALFAFFGALSLLVFAAPSRVFVVVPQFIEFFGFGGRRYGVLNQGRHGLNIRNGFRYDILRKRIADNRWGKGWDLQRGSLIKTDYFTSVLNNPLEVSCKNFQKSDSFKASCLCDGGKRKEKQ